MRMMGSIGESHTDPIGAPLYEQEKRGNDIPELFPIGRDA
jgi:hypothetical protein